jgi:hypothetical protein
MADTAAVKEHPEDRAMRLKGVSDAKRWIGPFWRAHWPDFVELVQTYGDADAVEKLGRLRERFWSKMKAPSGPPPRGAK